jgi:hypothetical protein
MPGRKAIVIAVRTGTAAEPVIEQHGVGGVTMDRVAGLEESRQSEYDCESGHDPAKDGTSLVGRSIPMPNRATGEDRPEEDLAKHDDHCRVLQPSVPPGNRPDAPGLRAAVDRLIAASQACEGPEIELWDDLVVDEELPPGLQSAMLSIVQELLLNACRHSKSKRVLLGLAQDDGCVCVQVQDWGIGFDSESEQPHKRGLKGVRDLVGWLGGTIDIDSQRGKGACIVVEVPLPRETGPITPTTDPRPE